MNALINGAINSTWGRLSGMVKTILVVGFAVLVILLVWFYGVRAWNHVGNWWHARQVAAAQSEIDAATGQAAQAKAIAEHALKELEAERQVTAAERAKRELLEGILTDKRLNANEKLKAYEAAMAKTPTVSPVPDSFDELCARAASLSIPCDK